MLVFGEGPKGRDTKDISSSFQTSRCSFRLDGLFGHTFNSQWGRRSPRPCNECRSGWSCGSQTPYRVSCHPLIFSQSCSLVAVSIIGLNTTAERAISPPCDFCCVVLHDRTPRRLWVTCCFLVLPPRLFGGCGLQGCNCLRPRGITTRAVVCRTQKTGNPELT